MRITMRESSDDRIQKNKLPDQVFDVLMDWIMTGQLSMGDKLVTDEIANKMGVSRMPVREAISDLEAIGLAETIPYTGTRLVKLGKKDIQEIYLARSALEPIAARFACINITEEELKNVEAIHHEYEEALKKEHIDPQEMYMLNRKFHFAIYKTSRLPRICEYIERLWDNLAYFKFIYGQKLLNSDELRRDMVAEHASYVQFLKDGDSDGYYYEQKKNLEKRAAAINVYTDGYFDEG